MSQPLTFGAHSIATYAVDAAGNTGDTASLGFTVIDPSPPISAVPPTDTSNPAPPDTPKPATLAKPMHVSSVLTKGKIRFSLSTPGTVELRVTRTVHGKVKTVASAVSRSATPAR